MSTPPNAMHLQPLLGDMIAGSLPMAGTTALGAVALVFEEVLGTQDVHAVIAADDKQRRVHYFAVPSRVVKGMSDLRLPLTAALPGHPAHAGEGAYVLRIDGSAAVAFMVGGELRLVYNTTPLIDALVKESGLKAYDVTAVAQGDALESRRVALRRLSDRVSILVTRWAGALCITAVAAYVGLAAAAGWLGGQAESAGTPQQRELQLRLALDAVQLSSPLGQRLARLQQITAVAVRAGGWIDAYQYAKDTEHFRLLLPEWVSRDYQQGLDPDVRADLVGDRMIEVVKGKPPRIGWSPSVAGVTGVTGVAGVSGGADSAPPRPSTAASAARPS